VPVAEVAHPVQVWAPLRQEHDRLGRQLIAVADDEELLVKDDNAIAEMHIPVTINLPLAQTACRRARSTPWSRPSSRQMLLSAKLGAERPGAECIPSQNL
jgi:hypothetical protein